MIKSKLRAWCQQHPTIFNCLLDLLRLGSKLAVVALVGHYSGMRQIVLEHLSGTLSDEHRNLILFGVLAWLSFDALWEFMFSVFSNFGSVRKEG